MAKARRMKRSSAQAIKPQSANAIEYARTQAGRFPAMKRLSAAAIDAIAEKQFNAKVLGGFNPKIKCSSCYIALPLSGVCNYCD